MKILQDGTMVEVVRGIPYVSVLEVGTDPKGFWSFTKNQIKTINNKAMSYEWEYEWFLQTKGKERSESSHGSSDDWEETHTES